MKKNTLCLYKDTDSKWGSFGIEKVVPGKTFRLFQVIDNGDPLGQTLVATPYLNCDMETVENKMENLVDPDEGVSDDCFFWEVEGDDKQSQENFRRACEHYRTVYGVRGGILDKN